MHREIKMISKNFGENEIFLFLDFLNSKNSDKIINRILEKIKEDSEIGFAGFQDKKVLKSTLKRFICSWKEENIYFNIKKEQLNKLILLSKEVLKDLEKYSSSPTKVFIFPCFDNFTIGFLNGVGGFCPWENVIFLFFHPKDNWEEAFRDTLIHEFAHSVSSFYKGLDFNLGEGLIFDGLAENFRKINFGGSDILINAVSKEKALNYYTELKDNLDSKDFTLYMGVFYGIGKYPVWLGYSMGYYLVKEYLQKLDNLDWNKLLRINPQEILREIIKNV